MDKVYSQAFTEVLEVLKNSEKNIVSKIPERFIEFLNEYKDNNYEVNINFLNEDWEKQVRKETQAILALIYRDYIVSKEKKERLLFEEKKEQLKLKEELKEKYNLDNVFKNKKSIIQDKVEDTKVAMVEYKETLITKIIKKIKNIFKRK